jgi:hypothetical protein
LGAFGKILHLHFEPSLIALTLEKRRKTMVFAEGAERKIGKMRPYESQSKARKTNKVKSYGHTLFED